MVQELKKHKSWDEVKHAAILKAATRLFLKSGYSSTSMEAIALAAKVTKQTVYAHYKSKDALFTCMVEELSKKHAPSASVLMNMNQPVEQLLYNVGLSLLNMLTSKEGLAATRLVIAELQHHPELAKRYYENGTEQMLQHFASFLLQLKKQKKLHVSNASSAAACFFSMLKGRYYVRMLLEIKPTPDPREKARHVKETVANFLTLYGNATKET